jgi:parvulin-like peptidyl-prolyl isomerase
MLIVKRFWVAALAAVMFSAGFIPAAAHADMVDKVIVVVNDEVITQREFQRIYDPIKANYEANFIGDELKRRLDAAHKGLLEQLINTKLTVSLAKKAKVKIDENELDERIAKIREYYPDEEEFLKALSERGTNFTEFKNELRDQMIAQQFVQQEVAAGIDITPAEIKDIYEKNRDQLVAPLRVRLKGIMVKKDEASGGADRKKIEDIRKKLAAGEDFGVVATEFSEGPYAGNAGDMGYIAKGQTIDQIDSVIFSLKDGERSDIVETDIGYHIFLAEGIEPEHTLPLEEVNDFLKQQLYMKRFEEKMAEWLKAKRNNAHIEYK